MLKKEWLWNLFKMVSWSRYVPLIVSYLKGGRHATTIGQRQMRLKGERTQIGRLNWL
jgi:hypothetical protein